MKSKNLVTNIFVFRETRISSLSLTVIGIWLEYKADLSGANMSQSLSSIQGPLTIFFPVRQNSIKIIANKVVLSIYF